MTKKTLTNLLFPLSLAAACLLLVIASTLVIGDLNTASLAQTGDIKIDTKGRVEFDSITNPNYKSGEPTITINAQVFKPTGDGPFPAMVLLHDRFGVHITQEKWAARLVEWGYVALLVDSLGPRGLEEALLSNMDWSRDAYGALNYLESLDFVDSNRVGLIGWDFSGSGVLTAVSSGFQELYSIKKKFKVGIAYYPYCMDFDFNAPVLIFFGDDDVLQQYFLSCKEIVEKKMALGKSIEMIIYPGASHVFDYGINVPNWFGKPITYDPVAEKDAIKRVKAFLHKHL